MSFYLLNICLAFSFNPFSTEGFPERWFCGEWPEWLGWTHIISDLIIFVSYQLIPIFALVYMKKKKIVTFPPLFILFGAFVGLCGLVHLIEAIIFWHPIYPLAGIVKAMTAVVSSIAAFYCFRLMPKALNLPTLAESEIRHRVLINAIPLSVLEVDYEGKILTINKETERIFKYSQEELVGKNIEYLIPERFKKEHEEHFNLYCQNPTELKLQSRELLAKNKHGDELYVEIALTPSPNKRSLICSIVDINERVINQQKLDARNSEMRSLFSFGLLGYVKSSLDGKIIEADDFFLSLIGYSREEFEADGINWTEVTPANVLKQEVKLIDTLKKEKVIGPYEKQYIHKKGHSVDVLIGVSLVNEEEGLCSCYVLDISNLKNKERELQSTSRKLQQSLEKQIDGKAQIQKYLEELKITNNELDDFVHTVSHDLKEPLRAIGGLSSLILHKSSDSMKQEEVKELLNDIVNLSKRSRDQIDSLLSYSMLGTKQLKLVDFDIKEVVTEVVQSFDFQAGEKNAEISILNDFPKTVYADKAMVTKVFENLLSNSLKHTCDDPQIKIGTEVRDGVIYYYVEDNGVGIKDKDKDFIFRIFKTLNPGANNTGAGLAIVKKIINSHKGRILVESTVGKGAKFLFSLEGKK